MKKLVSENSLSVSENHKPESLLAHWLTEITNFHGHYHQLVASIGQKIIEQDSSGVSVAYIGQCPVSQLVKLLSTMSKELEKLNSDIDHTAELGSSNTTKNYNKLMTHTRVLNGLNQRAQSGLYLTTLSSS